MKICEEWFEELTGMTKEEILAEMDKPREKWCRPVLQLVIAILLAEGDIRVHICRREDMSDFLGGRRDDNDN